MRTRRADDGYKKNRPRETSATDKRVHILRCQIILHMALVQKNEVGKQQQSDQNIKGQI